VSSQAVASVVLGYGDIKAKVHQLQEGSSQHFLHIAKVGELEGFALHATSKQLEAIYEALKIWSEETSRPGLCSTCPPPSNGAFMKTQSSPPKKPRR
jgi:hypothetical protein